MYQTSIKFKPGRSEHDQALQRKRTINYADPPRHLAYATATATAARRIPQPNMTSPDTLPQQRRTTENSIPQPTTRPNALARLRVWPARAYMKSPLIRRTSCMSRCMIVTRRACSAHKFESSNRCTRYLHHTDTRAIGSASHPQLWMALGEGAGTYASVASWRARSALDCHRRPTRSGSPSCSKYSVATSRTRRAKGRRWRRRSVDF